MLMKLHFEPDLDYQHDAINAVVDLFRGQEINRTEFTVTKDFGALYSQDTFNELGIGNRLQLLNDEVLKNLNDVQLRNGLAPSPKLETGDFTIEMETGTGKTYVYLRTIFELHKNYGFTKFVIVVPSVAIKEGVYKSLQMTEDHFRSLYANAPYNFFLYDSSKLGQVRDFATSPNIRIMVVTVGAINKKDVNNLYKDSEKIGGEKPIDLIKATFPILIVDEPQSVDGGLSGAGKTALNAMNPLCTLRYSATHRDQHNMVYRLDAVDAYEQKLVKQIEVASARVEGAHNKPYVRFVSSTITRGTITAKVELDIPTTHGIQRQERNVQCGDQLDQTTERDVYHDCVIGEISIKKGQQFMELRAPGDSVYLKIGEYYGDVDPLELQRQMIRRTIKEHLDKELRLRPQGIKVLSLFFIDKVEKYRKYDTEGNAHKGEYALIFEEEYRSLSKHPNYHTLFEGVDLTSAPDAVHDGYFSIDKKGGWTDTEENNQGNRENAERAYNLIMKEKEKLLSFETKLKFIFSHSALKEGWDNPNVFQICSLRDMGSERERRQTIGRGLRLCVNQQGERLRGFEINTLTVIATESYEKFAEELQTEIERDTGIRFGIVERYQFATIPTTSDDGITSSLGVEQSEAIWNYLKDLGMLSPQGKVQDALKTALKEDTLVLPAQFAPHLPQVKQILKKLAGRLEIKDADERKPIKTRQAVLDSAEFKALWDRIKHKTTYRVQFDNEKLIESCIRAINEAQPVSRTRLQWRKADLTIGKSGVETKETSKSASFAIDEHDIELPDLLTDLQDKTALTRRSIVQILTGSMRLDDFKRNPQQFIDIAAEAINRTKRLALVDGIKYQRVGDEHYYAQSLFNEAELTGYLKNMLEANKSAYEYVVYDSQVERSFADDLEKNESVKVYAKLPGWFTIPTPLGNYNPDWAVLVERDGVEQLYFVVETKGGLYGDDLRLTENAKIECGKAHFEALALSQDHPARFIRATSVDDVLNQA